MLFLIIGALGVLISLLLNILPRIIEKAREEGIKVGSIRLKTVWPFPEKRIRELSKKVKGIVFPELNMGQIVLEAERIACGNCRIVRVPHAGGWVHDPEVIFLDEPIATLDPASARMVKDMIEKYGSLDENYTFGIMPKLAIIGTEKDMPYYVMLDLGLEDIVEEPSGDDLWLKTDNFYGDLNDDGFMDVAVGRIPRSLEKGSWQLFYTRKYDEKQNMSIGILAEYNHKGFFDVLALGGSMANGFAANLNLRSAERLVENRFSLTDKKGEEKKIKNEL